MNPLRPPVLLDEGSFGHHFPLESPRNIEQLTAAEERLRELGFAVEVKGNVIAWQYCQEPYIILADPRVRGSLSFCVHDEARLAAHRRKRKSRSWDSLFKQPPLMAHFHLLDSWRHDLAGKFQTRLQKTIATLEPPRG